MNSQDGEVSVYGLVTELCKRFINKHKSTDHPYLPQNNDSSHLRKLKSRAFEILLKKSPNKVEHEECSNADPVVELLKYTFVLKTALRRYTSAEELENSLDELYNGQDNLDENVYSVLQFLNCLKSFQVKEKNTLDVFNYGRPNPLLPEQPRSSRNVPRYQTYPIESLMASDRFETMLGAESAFHLPENAWERYECLPFESQFKSATTIGIETLSTKSERTIGSMIAAPKYTVRLVSTREFSISSYFIPQIMDEDDEKETDYVSSPVEVYPDPEPAWLCVKAAASRNCETCSEASDVQSTNIIYNTELRECKASQLEMWDYIDVDLTDLREHRTWETLGRCEAPRESPFVTEMKEAILHLERIRQGGFLFLLPLNVVSSMFTVTEIPTERLMGDIKLLLLGVESRTFVWKEEIGFNLLKNTTVSGLSVEAVKSACEEIVHWGGCYKSLCTLIKPDPHTGKLQQEGLIFRAMCSSVKELLLYYQAVILRITVDHNEGASGLLRLLRDVRPIGTLIAEVARLCRCDRSNSKALGEGLGILSHIYNQVTKITKPNVALVFYSILKSCCEVYFRLLQKWLFEGVCDDKYGEFMIKISPQYAREKGHSFWTKAFAINKKSVPGFISELAESILQCGKTVRLLKICDPKNQLIAMCENCHPTVRVCLSVGMIREQELICREFMNRGEKILGPNVSLLIACEEEKRAERERAELVMSAQRDTLVRIKRQREEMKMEEARNKRVFLAELKDQAEQVASRKEREKEAELLEDKKILEGLNAAAEIEKNALIADKKNTIDYYNELAAEAERRKIHADWRARRMRLFDYRVELLARIKREFEQVTELLTPEIVENDIKNVTETEKIIVESTVVTEDINKNSTTSTDTIVDKTTETVTDSPEKLAVEIGPKKSPRPCVLDVKKTTGDVPTNLNDYLDTMRFEEKLGKVSERPKDLRLVDSAKMTEMQRNKLKVLEEEYGMTPNNNEFFSIIVMDAEGNKNTISIDASTINNENQRKTLEMEKCRNRNRNMRHRTDPWTVEGARTEEHLSIHEGNDNNNPPNGKTGEMTEAQRNRMRNMSHTYCDSLPEQRNSQVNFANATELQRNRARVMGYNDDDANYRNNEDSDFGAQDLFTPASQVADCANGVTPMSCTTDTFPMSTSENSTHPNNCDDFYSVEVKSTSFLNAETPSTDSAFVDNSEATMANNFGLQFNCYSKFFGLEAAATPIFESSLTVDDVEMIDNTSLQVYLQKSVATPLRVQSRLANAAIVKYLIYDCSLLSHLRSLRSFFFLLNGEFAKSLTNSLYTRLYEISEPIDLFKQSTLTNFLEQALNSSLSSSYENSERLSLSAIDVPTRFQVSNPEFLNCICLNYKISWPLNIIIDDRIMQQYSKVFKFLLMVGRVLYVLQEDFHILKVDRKATITSQYHKLQLYRHSMMQFVTALHNYLTCSVLQESWTEFEKELGQATTIDEINLTHVGYVKKILSRCMLTSRSEKMRTFLCNIFKIILKFHNRVRSQNWSSGSQVFSQVNFDRLENMYKTFCDARAYLAHVANKLASSGYQPHLTHFLNALNINPLYDLTSIKSSKKA